MDKELLEALSTLIDTKLDAQKSDLLQEMQVQNTSLREEMTVLNASLREEMHTQISALRGEMREQKADIIREVNVLLECHIQPQLNLLAEGQQAMMDKLAPRTRVEALEEKVDFLESTVRRIVKDVDTLKKAQ